MTIELDEWPWPRKITTQYVQLDEVSKCIWFEVAICQMEQEHRIRMQTLDFCSLSYKGTSVKYNTKSKV